MSSNEEALRALHAELLAGKSTHDPYRLIHRLAEGGYVEAKGTIEGFLNHADPMLRSMALSALTLHWQCDEHRQTCEHMAVSDPDEEVRLMAVSGIGSLLRGTRDRDGLAFLVSILEKDDTPPDIFDTAYQGIGKILGHGFRPLLKEHVDRAQALASAAVAEARAIVHRHKPPE